VADLFGGISASLRRECKACGVVGYATAEHYEAAGGLCPDCASKSPEQSQQKPREASERKPYESPSIESSKRLD
jgi:hypothetical protein